MQNIPLKIINNTLMRSVSRSMIKRWLLLFFLLTSNTVLARSDDIKQPVNIDADSVTFNRAKGYAVYQGNVSIKQGTLSISAAKIEIFAPKSNIVRIEASGSPVRFQQEMDDGKMAKGQGNTLRYLVQEKKLLLAGNAQLTQGKDFVSSGSISYSVNTGELKAGGDKRQGKKTKERVKAIFYPSN